MTTSLNALNIRRHLGRNLWTPPVPFGPDGWAFGHKRERGRIFVTCADHDNVEWVHASIAFAERMPTYEEIKTMHRAVFGPYGWSYEVFAPASEHIDIHEYARHLWGRLDGSNVLPNFGAGGHI